MLDIPQVLFKKRAGVYCIVYCVLYVLCSRENRQLHARWRINERTVLIKEHVGFTVTAYILRAQYELLTL